MKIISWNVNGVRAVVKKGFSDFLNLENPDIFCLQETKAFEKQFLDEVGNIDGYNYIWHTGTKAGYAGTVIFYKKDLDILDMKNHFGEKNHFHDDGRVTEIEFKDFVLINAYYPNGGQKVTKSNMLDYKLKFYDIMIDYASSLVKSGKNIILTGDFNICHQEIDIARPKENENSIGFLPIERKKIGELLDAGFVDVWRELNPDKKDVYSWWSYRAGARPRNIGWRLDYFIVNISFFNKIKDMSYLSSIMGSDHCPIKLEIN